MNMALCTAVKEGDLVKTRSILEDETGDVKLDILCSVDTDGKAPLHIASEEGHIDLVKYMTDLGANLQKRSRSGDAPLHYASRSGRQNVVQYLIGEGADTNIGDSNGYTPLYLASEEGHFGVVECLLNAGAGVNNAAKNGSTPLRGASYKGHIHIVKYLLNNGADLDRRGYNGQTPLRTASFSGHIAVVNYLISQNADKDMGDNNGYTPLHIASQEGHLRVVECLVNAGADVNKAAKNGVTSLDTAAYGHVDIVKYLISQGANPNSVNNDGYTPLYSASQEGHLDIVECLVKAGADVKKAAKNSVTPLRAASCEGHVDIVKYLITQGANPNSVDNDGYSPLHVASQRGHLDVVECLVNAGGDVNKPAIDGDLPLHAASRGGYRDIIKYLITEGADIEARNKLGWTVFHFAADNGNLESLEYFVRNNTSGTSGISHNALELGFQTSKGVTPLMAAARGGHLDCVHLLLKNNADIDTEDTQGWTVLHYAATSGNETMMRNLLARKAFMSTRRSGKGQSPIIIALSSGKADTARVLLDKDATSVHHSDFAGLTPIYLATMSGLSSIIEELISLGADVNSQAHDGQTPLHVAIRLCHCNKRKVEVTTALQQIQQESEDDLSPAEALIQFLMNQGSKTVIKDNEGFTPVQYARDERIRQMVLRSLPEDDVHEFRDLPIARSTESHGNIGCEGGILHLDGCDVTMSIPPRRVQAGSCHDVSIALVSDDPPPIREREFITGYGIEITLPAQWRYSKVQPITLSLPHAATSLKSNDVHADIIWKHSKSTSVHRERSIDGYTQSILKKRDIKLVIEAPSVIQDNVQLWIPIKLHYHSHGKQMVCTPFLPIDMAYGEDITLRMYIHEDIPYIFQKIQEDEENLLYHHVHPGRCFGLEPESSDIELECNGERTIISATELFNRQKTLVSISITTETNARMQMMNISISATSTNQPKTSMAFVAMRTGFSSDIHPTLDEMVPGSNLDFSIVEEIRNEDFITKRMNTGQYYHLGVALGLSYQTLDSILLRSRQLEDDGVFTPNQKAAIFMIRYWKSLQHPVSLADDRLRAVLKSLSVSGDLALVLQQRRRAERKHDTNVEDFFKGKFPREEPRTIPKVGLHAHEMEIPGARGDWAERFHHKRANIPGVRSDSLSSFSTLLEREEGRFPKRYGAHIPGSVLAHKQTFPTSRHIPHMVQRVLSIDDHHEDEDKYHSEGIFDQTGGELQIPSYGLSLSIPPGALQEGSSEKITLGVLTDIPPEITVRHDETLVTVGFQCLPSGLQFLSEKPVKLKIPHCANLIDPTKVQVVLYSLNKEGEVCRTPQTSRTCLVTSTNVEILLEHFFDGVLAFVTDVLSMNNKMMSFMPFLPKIMPQCREMMLEFRMVSKPNGKSWRDVHAIRENAEYQPAKDDDDEMNFKPNDMEVTCQLSDNDTLKENVDASFIRKNKHTFYFELDFNGRADDLPVKLKVKQSERQMDIKFRTHFLAPRGITETSPRNINAVSPRSSASTSVDIPPQGVVCVICTSKARPTKESREQEFDDILEKVAEQLYKNADINSLGRELGFGPPEIQRYIQTNEKTQNVTHMGTLGMLRAWRNRTKRSEEREKMKKALIAIKHRRLADDLL